VILSVGSGVGLDVGSKVGARVGLNVGSDVTDGSGAVVACSTV
jgi:hypothetical protein